jgi:hypothetical protein
MRQPPALWARAAIRTTLLVALLPLPATAEDWAARKCALYARAWQHAARGDALDGVGAAFVAAHDAFLASGCREGRDVCPVGDAERALADTLTLMAVAEGMTGSFLPFACAEPAAGRSPQPQNAD